MRHTFLLSLLALLLTSCRTIVESEPVILTKIQHDTITVQHDQRDSIYLHDSVYIHAIGDTIYRDRWHTQYIERTRWRDSIVIQRDTIPIEVPTTKVVRERYIPWYSKALSFVGLIALGAIGIYILGRTRWW